MQWKESKTDYAADTTTFIKCMEYPNLIIDSDVRHMLKLFLDSKITVIVENQSNRTICFWWA